MARQRPLFLRPTTWLSAPSECRRRDFALPPGNLHDLRKTLSAQAASLPGYPGLATLAACSPVGTRDQPPQPETPAHWSEAAATAEGQNAALRQWWSLFNDPLLDSLIGRANANLDLHIAGNPHSRGQGPATIGGGGLVCPQLISAAATSTAVAAKRSSGGTKQELFEADFDGWELDFAGRRKPVNRGRRGNPGRCGGR